MYSKEYVYKTQTYVIASSAAVIRFYAPCVISRSWAAMASFLLFSLLFSLSPSIAPITSFSNSTVQCEVILKNKNDDFTDNYDSNNERIQYA
jgi:hypothetical protein